MKNILCKKTGVTILEGLIALGLLALVAAGTFGVLLSVSRKAGSPDIRESMTLAVERAYDQLQMYAPDINSVTNNFIPDELKYGLCGNDSSPLAMGRTHNINCMLPPICDRRHSSFSYTTGTEKGNIEIPFSSQYGENGMATGMVGVQYTNILSVRFFISCNGFTL